MDSLKNKTNEEKLDWYRGKILSGSVEIEKALGWRLRTYFFPKSTVQASIFFQSVLNANYFSFERKITLYKQIPYFKKLKNYNKIINSLRFIQKIRNEVAHWELLEVKTDSKDSIVICHPISFLKRKLNINLIKEFTMNDQILLKSFGWNYKLETKYGVKNRSIFSKRNTEIREFARQLSKHPWN